MAFSLATDYVGASQITNADDVQRVILGTIVQAVDPTFGVGQFMYLQNNTGVTLAVGDVVTIDNRQASLGAVAQVASASRGQVGVAMAILTNLQYGWFQVSGSAVVKSATAAAAAPAYLNAVAASLISTVVAGQKVDSAVFKSANGTPSAGFAVCQLAEPSANGNG